MIVPFFDPTRAAREPELIAAFQRVLRSGRFILGTEVDRFERACAERLGVRHAIGVSSGTDALLAALLALDVGPGAEVVCPAYTFFATAGAIARLGATPVFADVDPESLTLDPDAARRAITPRTRAIIPVHLFGRAADLDGLARAADSIPLVEDAAQAFGTRGAGTVGALGCFSFFPTKNLGGFGDGGLVITGDDALARRVRALRAHGAEAKHLHTMIGGNFRLDALQAALLAAELPEVDARLAARRALAARYEALFTQHGLAGARVLLPAVPVGATVNQYVIRVPGDGARDGLRAFLAESGVGTEIYYPRPLHLQPCFAHLGHTDGSFPVAEAAARETLALPIFPGLREEEILEVVTRTAAFFTL